MAAGSTSAYYCVCSGEVLSDLKCVRVDVINSHRYDSVRAGIHRSRRASGG